MWCKCCFWQYLKGNRAERLLFLFSLFFKLRVFDCNKNRLSKLSSNQICCFWIPFHFQHTLSETVKSCFTTPSQLQCVSYFLCTKAYLRDTVQFSMAGLFTTFTIPDSTLSKTEWYFLQFYFTIWKLFTDATHLIASRFFRKVTYCIFCLHLASSKRSRISAATLTQAARAKFSAPM